MKKKNVVSLLLAVMMCIGLCACGGASGPTPEEQIIGTWVGTNVNGTLTLVCEEDYEGSIAETAEDWEDVYAVDWEYDSEKAEYEIVIDGLIGTAIIEDVEGVQTMTFDWSGSEYTFTKQATE